MRRAARTDSVQKEIIAALERVGCLVYDLKRPVDLLVLRGSRLFLIECKSATTSWRKAGPGKHRLRVDRGTLTDDQERFIAQGWPVHVCWSADDAMRSVGLLDADGTKAVKVARNLWGDLTGVR